MLNRVGPSMCVVTKRHALRDSELSKKNLRVLQSVILENVNTSQFQLMFHLTFPEDCFHHDIS